MLLYFVLRINVLNYFIITLLDDIYYITVFSVLA